MTVHPMLLASPSHTLHGHHAETWQCALSGPGHIALSTGVDGATRLWDARRGRELQCLSVDTAPWGCALSGDASVAAAAVGQGVVRIWDASVGTETAALAMNGFGSATDVAMTPDGRMLYANLWSPGGARQRWNGRVVQFDLRTNGQRDLDKSRMPFLSLTSNEQGSASALSSGKPERQVLPSIQALNAASNLASAPQPSAVTASGHRRCTTNANDKSPSPTSLRDAHMTQEPVTTTTTVVKHEQGNASSHASENTATMTDANPTSQDLRPPSSGRVFVPPQSSYPASIKTYTSPSGIGTMSQHWPISGRPVYCATSNDGIIVATTIRLAHNSCKVVVFDSRTGGILREITEVTGITRIAMDATGRSIALADERSLRICRLSDGAISREFPGYQPNSFCAMSAAGDRVIASGSDDRFLVWNTSTCSVMRVLDGHTGLQEGCAMNVDGTTMATCSDDCTVKIWRMEGVSKSCSSSSEDS